MRLFLLILLFFSFSAHSAGPYLMAGGGINFSSFQAFGQKRRVGPGLNLKTDLGYFLDRNWGLEWSSQVKFNQISELFIWDTLMTVGIRYKFRDNPYFVRGFFGRSPTVIYLDDAPEVVRETNSSRLHFNGPIYGLGVGKMFEKKNGSEWFIEGTASFQKLEEQTGVRNDGDVPVEVFEDRRDNPFHIVSVYATIGFRIF